MFGLLSVIPLWARLVGVVAIAGGLFAGGYTRGAKSEREAWQKAQVREQAGIAAEVIALTQAAARSALAIADQLAIARQYIGTNEVRTRYIVKEVARAIDAAPTLAVPLPGPVRELRAEQAAQSAAIADRARRGAGQRPDPVPAADR